MNARDRILTYDEDNRENLSDLLDAFAHELAERQRAALPDVMDRWFGSLHQDAISEVIDLIDPQAQRAITEGDTP